MLKPHQIDIELDVDGLVEKIMVDVNKIIKDRLKEVIKELKYNKIFNTNRHIEGENDMIKYARVYSD